MSVKQIFNTSAELDYPTVLPTLDLNFANSKTLDPRITFTRSSGGSYVGADGLIKLAGVNEARFDHDPYTGESLGLLVEEQRTNSVLQSETFSNWTVQGLTQSTVSNANPDGHTNVALFTENTDNSTHRLFTSLSTGQTVHIFSIWVKIASGNRLFYIESDNSSGVRRNLKFNLQTGTVDSNPGDWTGAFITPYANGWFRVGGTITDNGGSTLFIVGSSNATLSSYTGDGTSGIYLWGAQIEVGAFPTSYIPTTTAAATRSADLASITGSAFSGFYRQDEGTVFAEASSFAVSGLSRFNTLIQGATFSDRWVTGVATTNQYQTFIASGGISEANLVTGTYSPSTKYRMASAIKANDIGQSIDGASPQLDASAILFTANQIQIGSAGAYLNGHLRRLCYWPQRLSNQVLQSITR